MSANLDNSAVATGLEKFRFHYNPKKEENNRMGKTRDRFKKIRDSKGTFHAKMGSIKDRNNKDLTEETEEEVARIHRRTAQKRS